MIEYEETWLVPLLFKLEGSVYVRSALWSVPSAVLTCLLVLYIRDYPDISNKVVQTLDFDSLSQSHLWSALTVVLVFMVSFRTRQGLSRFWEGTGLLHQMKGEWFDTVSNCVTFTINTKKDDSMHSAVAGFRHTIVRLMSLCHASALEEISNMGAQMETIDVLGLNSATLRHLKDCVENHKFNKVEVLLHLVQSLITKAHADGILQVPPPILSRVYQTISRGYVNLLNTKKITDTKFPFPYVQLITLLLFAHTLFTPLVVAVSVDSLILAPIVAFIPLFGLHSMNFIAMELEDPFGMDDNDLPLNEFQSEMNNCLLMLVHPNTDLVAGINADRCVMDFYELKNSIYRNTGFESEARDVPVTAQLFSPSFRVMGTNHNLEAAADGAFEGDSNSNSNPPEQIITDQTVGISPSDGAVSDQDPNRAARTVPESLEPKFSTSELRKAGGHESQQMIELEGMLSKSMEDFNKTLQSWTKTMEEQVQEISTKFATVREEISTESVDARQPKQLDHRTSTRRRDSAGTQGPPPGTGSMSRGGGDILQPVEHPSSGSEADKRPPQRNTWWRH